LDLRNVLIFDIGLCSMIMFFSLFVGAELLLKLSEVFEDTDISLERMFIFLNFDLELFGISFSVSVFLKNFLVKARTGNTEFESSWTYKK